MHELDGTICGELTDDGETRHKGPIHHQDPVVVTPRDQARQVIELDREAIDDSDQLEHLEVVRRRFAVRPTFGTELAIKVVKKPRSRANDASGFSLLLGCRLGLLDVLLEPKAHPRQELGRDLVQIGDDTCFEVRLLLGWAHLLEFGGSHDISGHFVILSPVHVSVRRPRVLPVRERSRSRSGVLICPTGICRLRNGPQPVRVRRVGAWPGN